LKSKAAATSDASSEGTGAEKTDSNTLKLSFLKVSGLPETAKPASQIQISSPIEELTLTKMFDPLNPEEEGSFSTINEVDIKVATLTVISANDADIYLGSSLESYDLAPLCTLDNIAARNKITQLDIAIIADGDKETGTLSTKEENNLGDKEEKTDKEKDETGEGTAESTSTDAPDKDVEVKESKEDDKPTSEESPASNETQNTKEGNGDDTPKVEGIESTPDEIETTESSTTTTTGNDKPETSSPTSAIVPICVVTLRVEYTPSKKEEEKALFELLNTAIKQKNNAVEKLRKTASALGQVRHANETSPSTTSTSSALTTSKPAVPAGFLNKKTKKKEPHFIVKLYNRSIGPDSMFRKVFPVAKNYLLFFGAVALFHFKGHELALPPPV